MTQVQIRHFFQPKSTDIFSSLHENICCGYSLEVPQRGTSNEYPQHMFSWINKKKIFCGYPAYLELCNDGSGLTICQTTRVVDLFAPKW